MLIFPIDHLPRLIPVGVQTSKGVEEIGFNVSAWLDKWPEMTFEVWPTRPTETAAYPAVSQLIGDVLVWYVSEADTAFDGLGTVEIVGIAEGIRKPSGPCTTEVKKTSLGKTQEPPDGIKPYYEGMMEAAQDARNAADEVTAGKALFVITTEIVNGKLIANRTIQEIQQATVSGRAVILANGSEVYTFIGYQKDNESGTGSIPTFFGKVEVNDKGILYAWNAQIRADGTVTAYSKAKKVVNPKKLHITGAVEATYDGSEEITVNIPAGGGGDGEVVDDVYRVTYKWNELFGQYYANHNSKEVNAANTTGKICLLVHEDDPVSYAPMTWKETGEVEGMEAAVFERIVYDKEKETLKAEYAELDEEGFVRLHTVTPETGSAGLVVTFDQNTGAFSHTVQQIADAYKNGGYVSLLADGALFTMSAISFIDSNTAGSVTFTGQIEDGIGVKFVYPRTGDPDIVPADAPFVISFGDNLIANATSELAYSMLLQGKQVVLQVGDTVMPVMSATPEGIAFAKASFAGDGSMIDMHFYFLSESRVEHKHLYLKSGT